MEQIYLTNSNLSKLIKFLALKMSPAKSAITAKKMFEKGISKEMIALLNMKPKKSKSKKSSTEVSHNDYVRGVIIENGKLVSSYK